MKSTDYEFLWFTEKNGSGWEVWRELASTWLHNKDYGVDHTLNAVSRFLDQYLMPRFIIDPVELFETKGQDYNKFLDDFEKNQNM